MPDIRIDIPIPSATGRQPSIGHARLPWHLGVALTTAFALTATAAPPQKMDPTNPDFGPNVMIFDPSMPTSEIQAAFDAIHARQVDNEMGPARYGLYFMPGTYGTDEEPLQVQVGYYTEIAGLGASPGEVQINGAIEVYNRCFDDPENPEFIGCFALNNFWRALSNLTINVNTSGQPGCEASANMWAVSQAVSMRRVDVKGGNLTLMDYCSGPSFASGGFIADSRVADALNPDQALINGSQQQWYTRNSEVGVWTNAVWNQVFSGVIGAPAPPIGTPGDTYPNPPYTVLETTPVSREKPYLFVDAQGEYVVHVPSAQHDTKGISWADDMTPGRSIPITDFFIARPSDSIQEINNQLARGKHLILTPGIYEVSKSIEVKRADTVVLGMGLATLNAADGAIPLKIADRPGIILAGVTIDAGSCQMTESGSCTQVGRTPGGTLLDPNPAESPMLLQVGKPNGNNGARKSDPNNPTTLSDVYFRVGGPHTGRVDTALQVNLDHVLIDHIWVWRADHGIEGFDRTAGTFGDNERWVTNIGRTGVVVNGDHVTATGLFVEHFQEHNTVWNGEGGRVILYQCELPYDPPTQADWMKPNGTLGWAGYKVDHNVATHELWGGGVYVFNRNDPSILTDNGYEVPMTSGVKLNHVMTKNLSGPGTIIAVVNGVGDTVDGILPCADPDVPDDPPNCGPDKGPFEAPSYVVEYP